MTRRIFRERAVRRAAKVAAPCVLVVVIGLLGLAVFGNSQRRFGEGGPDDVSDTAYRLRMALGFDPIILAALDVPQLTYDSIVSGAIDYANLNYKTVGPLLDTLYDSVSALGEPAADLDPTDAVADIKAAHAAIRADEAQLETQLTQTLNPGTQLELSNAAANAGLDSILRLLPLSEKQRNALWTATVVRDAVIRNPYRWHRASIVAAAREEFEARTQEILTMEQVNTLDAYIVMAEANLGWALDRERIAAVVSETTERRRP